MPPSRVAVRRTLRRTRKSLQYYHDRSYPELLLRWTAHSYHDNRDLEVVLASRITAAWLELQALEREYCCGKQQYLRSEYGFEYVCFVPSTRRGAYFVSITISSKTRGLLAGQKSTLSTRTVCSCVRDGTAIIAAALLLMVE